MLQRLLVWDVPTRVFHWVFALSFVGAFITAETERYRDTHLALGYLFLGLLVFRVIWGFIGTRYARFNAFCFTPTEVMAYLKSLIAHEPKHYVGHNPAGSIAILLLLGLGLFIGSSGVLLDFEVGGEMFEDLHETLPNIMLAVVAIHIVGVVTSSWLHGENLVLSMINGYKNAESESGIRHAYIGLGVIMAALIVAFLLLYQPGNLSAADSKSDESHQEE